jgi:hypothetical protein
LLGTPPPGSRTPLLAHAGRSARPKAVAIGDRKSNDGFRRTAAARGQAETLLKASPLWDKAAVCQTPGVFAVRAAGMYR